MNICFYNHYHNGDIHCSRSIIKLIMDKIKLIYPKVSFSYSHQNQSNLLADIEGLSFDPEAVHSLPEHENYIKRDNMIFINTWFGQKNRFYLNKYGMTIDALYSALNDSCLALFNFGMNSLSSDMRDFFPTIDYSKFEIESTKNWISQHPENKILIENSPANSGQATNFSMTPIIVKLAMHHKDTIFILSKKENVIFPNIFYTDDIIKNQQESDLNEISFLSTHCSMVVGRASGVFTFASTRENLLERKIKFLGFCNSTLQQPTGKFLLGSLFKDQVSYKSQFIFSDTINQDNIYRLIESNL